MISLSFKKAQLSTLTKDRNVCFIQKEKPLKGSGQPQYRHMQESLLRVLPSTEQRPGRLEADNNIEPQRPVFDVENIEQILVFES